MFSTILSACIAERLWHMMILYRSASSWAAMIASTLFSLAFGCVLLGFTSCSVVPSTHASPTQLLNTPTATPRPIAQVEPPRRDSAMAYDAAEHRIVLFGGTILPNQMTNETWSWNGSAWSHLYPASSPPALQGKMVYDGATGQLILFLSQVQSGGSIANELWAWGGATWQQLHPATMPDVIGASIVYDAARQQVVLFGGGVPGTRSVTYLNATWIWDGTTWIQRHPAAAPPPRTDAVMVYDSAQQQIVLYGGSGLSPFHDLWTWDGVTWQQQHPTSMPPARQQANLVYDEATQQIVLFGGLNLSETQALSDTWIWNGADWTQVASQGGPTALYASDAYDSDQQDIVVYAVQGNAKGSLPTGASSPMSQTWIWDGSIWKLLS